MRSILLAVIFIACSSVCRSQNNAVITNHAGVVQVQVDDQGHIVINVPPDKVRQFEDRGWVAYDDFGAAGDGQADDIDAIVATHAFANTEGLAVRAAENAIYYISGKSRTAIIQTDTDFGTAHFMIDDTEVERIGAPVFQVRSRHEPFQLAGLTTLKKGQTRVDVTLPGPCLVTVTNDAVRQYIRFGPNQNSGSAQTDIILLDKDGYVDQDAPIIWDFDRISAAVAVQIDETPLRITGGIFTTIANQAPSQYTYYGRNLAIRRSNVTVDGLVHHVVGEGEHGAPYSGFIQISDCAAVQVVNSVFTGRKTYRTVGAAGTTVSMGSYDISVNRAVNVSFINCSQTNDINDTEYWGIMGSNFSKNLVFDGCTLSRFDAHQGVANATIRNSTLGHMGINAIGSGLFLLENSTVYGRNLINLREDYGSTWEGEVRIRNCVFKPAAGKPVSASLISGYNSGQHDFGYVCHMPARIVIEDLHIDDANHPRGYQGPAIFANFNPAMRDDSYEEPFPYVRTGEVLLHNVTTSSGKPLRISDNPFLFQEVQIIGELER